MLEYKFLYDRLCASLHKGDGVCKTTSQLCYETHKNSEVFSGTVGTHTVSILSVYCLLSTLNSEVFSGTVGTHTVS